MALLPASAGNHYSAPGVSFLPLEGTQPVTETTVVSRKDSEHAATSTFLNAVSRTGRLRVVRDEPSAVAVAA